MCNINLSRHQVASFICFVTWYPDCQRWLLFALSLKEVRGHQPAIEMIPVSRDQKNLLAMCSRVGGVGSPVASHFLTFTLPNSLGCSSVASWPWVIFLGSLIPLIWIDLDVSENLVGVFESAHITASVKLRPPSCNKTYVKLSFPRIACRNLSSRVKSRFTKNLPLVCV